MKTKVVYNACYGGFSLSREAVEMAKRISGNKNGWESVCHDYGFIYDDVKRHDKTLVEVVEKLKEKASGRCSNLKIKEVDSPMYRIEEYDGYETVITPDDPMGWVSVID